MSSCHAPTKKWLCETNKLLKHTIKCLDIFNKMVEVQWWGRPVWVLLVWGDDEPFTVVHQEAASLTGHRVQNDRFHQSPTPWLHHWPIHHTHLQGNTLTHTSNPPPAQLRRRPLPGSGVSQVLPAPPLMTRASACAGPEWRRGRRGSSEPSDCCTVWWSLRHRRDPKKPDPRCRMGCQPAEVIFWWLSSKVTMLWHFHGVITVSENITVSVLHNYYYYQLQRPLKDWKQKGLYGWRNTLFKCH